jgi:hypothetical protein
MKKNDSIFERHEVKFLLDPDRRRAVDEAMKGRMEPDEHGESTICNIYYDTPDFLLARRSLEKPLYKEKLRLRSYGPAEPDDKVFLELKKKYKGVVYKRRISIRESAAETYLSGASRLPEQSQIGREIDYFIRFYKNLRPAVFLCYDRSPFFAADGSDLRMTFDRGIRFRPDRLSLTEAADGRQLLAPEQSLLEVKTSGAMPLWLVEALDKNDIRKISFSKYGMAYTTMLRERLNDGKGVFCA